MELASAVIDACATEQIEHMLTGALAYNHYGVPRSTIDVDFVVQIPNDASFKRLRTRLESIVDFEPQVQFERLTWGTPQVATTRERPPLKVELFDLQDDPFAQSTFKRRVKVAAVDVNRTTWLPTAEDVVVQKLRWGRSKDLDDALHVLAVQDPATLDMAYVERWCMEHGTSERLRAALDAIPPL